MFEEDVVNKQLGNKFKDIHIEKEKLGSNLKVYTGVNDLMNDEIILTAIPEEGIISDLGYTDYSLECLLLEFEFNRAAQLIRAHDVQLLNDYQQTLVIPYSHDDEEEFLQQVKKLTSCIVDMYAFAYFR